MMPAQPMRGAPVLGFLASVQLRQGLYLEINIRSEERIGVWYG